MLDLISSRSAAPWSGADMNPWMILAVSIICAVKMAGSSSRPLVASPDLRAWFDFLLLHHFLRRRSLFPCPKNVPCKQLTTVIPLQSIYRPATGFDTFICDPGVTQSIALRGRPALWHSGLHQLRRI